MISNEMLKDFKTGTVFKLSVPKKKRSYISYKNRNGKEDQVLSYNDVGDSTEWLFVGVNFVGRKKFLKCIEKEPVLPIEFRGGVGSLYGEKELNNISRHFFTTKGIKYSRSIRIDDINLLLGIEVKPSNRWYTFKKGDCSPESSARYKCVYAGNRVRHLAYSYNESELPASLRADIVFRNKSYWLANKTISVEEDCAYFGLGEVTKDGCVNMGHSLFKSDGKVLGGLNIAYVRSVIYIDPELFSPIKLNSGAFRLIES